MAKTLVFIPTYNERENAEKICEELLSLPIDADLLFLDDNSPDGTGRRLDELARSRPRLKVIHRPGKLGVGGAHVDGIRYAYDHGYQTLVTMDCDFTHPPKYVPDFIAAAGTAAVVVGSRYRRSDSLDEWNLYRWCLTRLGHFLTKTLLAMPFDATGAFRLYRLDRVPRGLFSLVQSTGYSFFFESLYILHRNGLPIVEVPITLPARTYGESKMAAPDVFNSVGRLVYLYLSQRWDPDRFLVPEGALSEPAAASTEAAPEWDEYWRRRSRAGGAVYDLIATFYRKTFIKPNLERFLSRNFAPGARLLHAGCGSGQVDGDVTKRYKVVALDISLPALRLYQAETRGRAELAHGSVFSLPLPDGSVDGVYNLGVMEHFEEPDIRKILLEFKRALKPGGKAVLFWPPEFGLSVNVFKALSFVFNSVLKKNVKFHPDEVCRLRGRAHAERLVSSAGLRLADYAFGPRDLFIQAVVVAEKPA